MMKIKNLLSAFALVALVVSCNGKDEPKPTPEPQQGGIFKGVMFATSITNPEGNSGTVYLQTHSDLLPGTYSIGEAAIPAGFGSFPIAFPNGHVYTMPAYMGNDKPEVNRYSISADGKFVKEGTLGIPVNASACNIVELSDTKAYISLQGLGIVMAFNPTTMTKIKNIDLNSLAHEDTRVAPAAMIIRDGKLYVGLSQMNAQFMPTKNTIEFAMIDTKTDELKKHIVNSTLGMSFATRPVDAFSIFMDENKDIYFNCLGAFGFDASKPGGVARIKNGTDEIDPNYVIRLDQTTVQGLSVGKFNYITNTRYHKDHKLYAYACAYGLDPLGMENPYVCMTCLPCVIDLEKKTIEVIGGIEVSNPQNSVSIHKNLIVFGCAGKSANGFYTYDPETKKVNGPVMKVQGFPYMFYSFAK